jgi:hypothetical protein
MPKPALKIEVPEHKNRFMRFTPSISMGNIGTMLAIIIAGTTAWAQMRSEVARLVIENDARKAEISQALIKSDSAREEFYKKMGENQASVHEEIKELTITLGTRFDRLDDKLDRKQDKRL